jgi:C4-dicarboxylate-specific signal transduction histidine kinase
MTPRPGCRKTFSGANQVMIFIVLATLMVTGCAPKEPPLSAAAGAFKAEVSKILQQMQKSLAEPTARANLPAIDAALQGYAKYTSGLCVDCPYRSAVLNKDGVLLTTFPKNDFVGRNFSSYTYIIETLRTQKITQRQAFQADGTKVYFISAPLLRNKQVAGIVVLGLTTADIDKKWGLTEKEFLAIDFNVPNKSPN